MSSLWKQYKANVKIENCQLKKVNIEDIIKKHYETVHKGNKEQMTGRVKCDQWYKKFNKNYNFMKHKIKDHGEN